MFDVQDLIEIHKQLTGSYVFLRINLHRRMLVGNYFACFEEFTDEPFKQALFPPSFRNIHRLEASLFTDE